jgi:hypothetical protein
MKKPCSILLFCVLLGFGVSVVVPAEDVPDTAYDESEAPPYVNPSVFSIAAPKALAPDGHAVVAMLRFGSLRTPAAKRFDKRIDSSYSIGDSFTIRDHSLRC